MERAALAPQGRNALVSETRDWLGGRERQGVVVDRDEAVL